MCTSVHGGTNHYVHTFTFKIVVTRQ